MRGGHKPTIVVANEQASRLDGACVVLTPLDMIEKLERVRISTVVLAGSFAADRELVAFLSESYPSLAVIADTDDDTDANSPGTD